MGVFQGFVGFVKHLGGDCAVEVGHGPFEVAVVHLDVKGGWEVLSGFVVDVKKLIIFISQPIAHVGDVIESFEVVWGETHDSPQLLLVYAFDHDVAGVSHDILVEFNSD